jgi:DNA-3-methyladenine glycosylase
MKKTMSTKTNPRLKRAFFLLPTPELAQNLLGMLLVRRLPCGERISGIIVEVEAYLAESDPASHSWKGKSRKNASMFHPAGTLYVYSIHSRHCLNVVAEDEGIGAAVLIRALEPVEGLVQMAHGRGIELPETLLELTPTLATRLTSGPGRLCEALQVDRTLDGENLISSSQIWLEACAVTGEQSWTMQAGPRIGISRAQEMPLRWFIDGHRFVSGTSRGHSRRRSWRFIT